MASPLAITLLPESSIYVDGAGDPFDVTSGRACARVTLRLTAITAGGLSIHIETSSSGVDNWSVVARLRANAAGDYGLTAGGLKGFVRALWALDSGTSGVVAGVTAIAHQLYCTPADLPRFGLPSVVLEELETTVESQTDACLAATDEAEGYLANRYSMPLVSWGDALRLHVAKLAIVSFLDASGWQPSGQDDVIMAAYTRAIAWLKGVGGGVISPPGIVDSSPTPGASGSGPSGARVTSQPMRGW
jgi:phage gp36-like protein